jgi:hypothetical protein
MAANSQILRGSHAVAKSSREIGGVVFIAFAGVA